MFSNLTVIVHLQKLEHVKFSIVNLSQVTKLKLNAYSHLASACHYDGSIF